MKTIVNCSEFDTIRYHAERLTKLGYTKTGDCFHSQIWENGGKVVVLNREEP